MEDQEGKGPVHDDEWMERFAHLVDRVINMGEAGDNRRWGFTVLIFPANETKLSQGADHIQCVSTIQSRADSAGVLLAVAEWLGQQPAWADMRPGTPMQ